MVSRRALRKAWFQVHKWIGLVLMVLLIPLGLSGIVLTWDDAIDHALNPQRYAVHGAAVLSPAAYAAAASKALQPGEHVAQLRYPDADGPITAMAMGSSVGSHGGTAKQRHVGNGSHNGRAHRRPPQRMTLWLDPRSGRVLDVMRGDTGLVRTAHNFHGMLFIAGGVGRTLIGLLGIAMFLMALAGVWLWWPPVGQWVKGLRWQRGDRRLDTNLHHRLGFWIALPLAAQAFTGVWMAWPQMMSTIGLAPARGGPIERWRMAPAAQTHLTADQALAAAQAARPGQPASIVWPAGDDGAWRISLKGKSGDVQVDDTTAAVSPAPPRDEGGLAMTMRHYHDGTMLGPVWRVLMVLLGMSPTLLGITGITMWLRTRRRRAAARRKRDVCEPLAAA